MKTRATLLIQTARQRGLMIVESLVYISLFFVIVGLAYAVVYRCWDFSKAVKRTTDDITRATSAGEVWRQDVRTASAALRVEEAGGGEVVHIPQKTGEVAYRFLDGALWRRAGESAPWGQVLPSVKVSRMTQDQRQRVRAWRWELELVTRREGGRMPPLFTFEAVSPGATP